MKSLHSKQKALLELLKETIDDPLTMRELQERLGLSSTSGVSHHIQQLEKKGYLKRNPHNPKDYQILGEPEKAITYLNLYGMAQCGPNGSILDGDPIDRIPIASRLISFPTEDAFLVRARGDSMKPKINEGDLVVARKTEEAQNNDTVVCVYQSEALIKQFFLKSNQILLQSLNFSKFPPIIANHHDVKVEGVVRGVIASF